MQSLFNYYTEQLENTPTLGEIQATNKILHKKTEEEKQREETQQQIMMQNLLEQNMPKDMAQASKKDMMAMMMMGQEEEKEKEEEKPVIPLYKVEFVLEVDSLTFMPDLDNFRDVIGEIMQQFKDTLLQVENLVPDKYFDAFTR